MTSQVITQQSIIDVLSQLVMDINNLGILDLNVRYDRAKIQRLSKVLLKQLQEQPVVDKWLRIQYGVMQMLVDKILESDDDIRLGRATSEHVDQMIVNSVAEGITPEIHPDTLLLASTYLYAYTTLFNNNRVAIEAKLNLSKRLAQSQFTKNIECSGEYEHYLLYQYYCKRWDETHDDKPKKKKSKNKKEPIGSLPITLPVDLIGPFGDKLVEYVTNQSSTDGLLSIQEFKRLVNHWPDTEVPLNECYNAYLELYANQPGRSIKIGDVEIRGSGFKTKNNPVSHKLEPTNYFPMKKNRRYMLHTVTRPGTYFIDLMYCGKFTFLVAIEANTRYIYAIMTNMTTQDGRIMITDVKNTRRYIQALTSMMERGMNPIYIVGDAESAFKSKESNAFYQDHNIQFIPVPRMRLNYRAKHEIDTDEVPDTDPYHTSLALVDRAIRTIRDMGYNMEVPQNKFNQSVMDWILHEYNNSYHKTLSKYAGFNVTPAMVHNDKNLEQRICNAIHASNWNIMHDPGFMLATGMRVKVYNDRDKIGKRRTVIRPGDWIVEGWERGKYKVKNNVDGYTCVMPRYKLSPVWT